MEKRKALVINKDLTIVGGGLAGVCAAVAAAREGIDVALIQDRPVLGGNSSSEIRVWAVGSNAMGNNRYAAESGIIGEIDLENLYRNPEGNPYLWDALLLDVVKREKKIELFLNTSVQEVEKKENEISSLTAYQSASEKKLIFQSRLYMDCTGDGSIGYWAGASYMQGKEGQETFGEDLAPEQPQAYTLGSTLFFYVRNTDEPVKFIPPDFAYPLEYIKDLMTRTNKSIKITDNGCDLWWIEYGGVRNTINDNESIKEELQRLVFGLWNYIKNSGEFGAEKLTLEWVGSIPGKRESRRFIGDLVLTQNHILQHQNFDDAVCSGGWPIDVHPEEGIYSVKKSCHQTPTGIYQIPLRCLYSKDIKNLMLAGRNISASHMAFASTRVMKTCALTGQAAGTAAAYVIQAEKLPYQLLPHEIKSIQQLLAKRDVWLHGLENPDREDIAGESTVTASGYRSFSSESMNGKVALDEELYILMPALEKLDTLQLMLSGEAVSKAEIEVYTADARQAYKGLQSRGTFRADYGEGMDWVLFSCHLSLDGTHHVIIKIMAQEGAFIGVAKESCCGVIGSIGSIKDMRLFHPCFKLAPEPAFFTPGNITNGITRPEKQPDIWISNGLSKGPAWMELTFREVKAISQIQLLFNPDFNRDFNPLRPDYYKNGWGQMPGELVKSFTLKAREGDGRFEEIARVDNQIIRQFCLNANLKTDCIRVEFNQTHGSDFAQVFEIRVYP